MENTQRTEEKDHVNMKWDYFYSLVSLERKGKDISSNLIELCSDLSSMAAESKTLEDYRNLANLNYQCTEILLREYDKVVQEDFPEIPEALFAESK